MKESPTSDQLKNILQSTAADTEKGWSIYRYLKANIGPGLESVEARRLLAAYMQLPLPRPSLLHSAMLGAALKASEVYPDVNLPKLLEAWGLGNLRREDSERQKDAAGKEYLSLVERLSAAVLRYSVHHQGETFDPKILQAAMVHASKNGYLPVAEMVAVKIFEKEHERRKVRMVKLVGADGVEVAADWHMFHAKPWEIAGKVYSVLMRRSDKTGNTRVVEVAPSSKAVDEVFGRVIGYVDRYDASHRHYHIFDNQSRHFVAEAPSIRITEGGYVWFAPIIPNESKFKTALVTANETAEAGREAFGFTDARLAAVNTEKAYFSYTTSAGEKGFGNISLLPPGTPIGASLKLISYLRRGKDGTKRPYIAEVVTQI